ncbi:hypothetical protein EV356DRAFT_534532 [Viridothelium virens]|uniref:HTH La-type RNA-binding domain-containing protein n=1 Tax=Viridothelium virens TaxID=1048519 RepID=A0A6A6H410_VIRVR|nr:hypothetical protein EV356DRAFT_534532 [Viridothelium virens]
MADLKVQATEPDPSATSIPNDQSATEKLTGKAVEAAKEPTSTPAEEVADAQEAAKQKEEAVKGGDNDMKIKSNENDTQAGKATASERNSGANNDNTNRRRSNDGKTNGHGRPNNGRYTRRNNQSKFDPSSLPETDDPDEIRKQVEFYFSDSNLPLDKFLFSQVGGPENKPFSIKQLHTFKRMKRFQPYSAVVKALKESDSLDVTENDEVKRKTPLDASLCDPDDNVKIIADAAMPRTIYVKGFGEESNDTQLAIEAFFAPYGPIGAIRLRRTPDRLFKGSIFVEFETEEAAKQFLQLDPPPKFHEMPLVIKSKKDYCEQKVEDIKSGKIQPSNNNRGRGQRNGRFQNRNGRDNRRQDNRRDNRRSDKNDSRGHSYRDGEDDRDWRTRRDEDSKKKQDDTAKNTRSKRERDEDEEEVDSTPVKKTKTGEGETEKNHVSTAEGAVDTDVPATKLQTKAEAFLTKKRSRDEDEEDAEAAPVKKTKTDEAKTGKNIDSNGDDAAETANSEPKSTAKAEPAISKKRSRDDDDDDDDDAEKASNKKAKAEKVIEKTKITTAVGSAATQEAAEATTTKEAVKAAPTKKRARQDDDEVDGETAKKLKEDGVAAGGSA